MKVEPATEGITSRGILAKRATASKGFIGPQCGVRTPPTYPPGEDSAARRGYARRVVNCEIFAPSDDRAGMEKNRVLLIGNDAFLPPSKRIGLSDDVVAEASVPSSSQRVLTTLAVE